MYHNLSLIVQTRLHPAECTQCVRLYCLKPCAQTHLGIPDSCPPGLLLAMVQFSARQEEFSQTLLHFCRIQSSIQYIAILACNWIQQSCLAPPSMIMWQALIHCVDSTAVKYLSAVLLCMAMAGPQPVSATKQSLCPNKSHWRCITSSPSALPDAVS